MKARAFRSTLWKPDGTGTTTFLEVPFDVKEAFGKARPPVRVTVNGYTYRSTVSVYDDKFYVVANSTVRVAAGLKPGDRVDVTLVLDDSPRLVEPPKELASALRKNRKAREAWNKLSFTHQREHADAIASAKKPETRTRRVENAIVMLAAVADKKQARKG